MRILYVAKFGNHDNADEEAVAYALEKLGHEVVKIEQESANLKDATGDLVLFHKWDDIRQMSEIKIPKVFWYFDLIQCQDNDSHIQLRNQQRVMWMRKVMTQVQLGFCTDGDWVNSNPNCNLIRLTQGADERVAGYGQANGPTIPILFTGLVNGGHKRRSHIEELKTKYGPSLTVVEGRHRIHGRELANLLARAEVVIAPDSPITNDYWSNRVYLTLGLGGFLLHPWAGSLTEQYESGKELTYYTCRDELLEQIHYYRKHVSEREELRRAGHEKTMASHTYYHRCIELMKTVKERLF